MICCLSFALFSLFHFQFHATRNHPKRRRVSWPLSQKTWTAAAIQVVCCCLLLLPPPLLLDSLIWSWRELIDIDHPLHPLRFYLHSSGETHNFDVFSLAHAKILFYFLLLLFFLFTTFVCVSWERERESVSSTVENCGGADLLSFPPHTQQFTGFFFFLWAMKMLRYQIYIGARVCFSSRASCCHALFKEKKKKKKPVCALLSFFGWGMFITGEPHSFFPTTVSSQALCRELVVKRSLERGYIFLSTVLFFFDICYITFICCVWLYNPSLLAELWWFARIFAQSLC